MVIFEPFPKNTIFLNSSGKNTKWVDTRYARESPTKTQTYEIFNNTAWVILFN